MDAVAHPKHYTNGDMECIEAIRGMLGHEGYQAYLRGNILKYLWRYQFKNGMEDLQKAREYLGFLIKEVESNEAPVVQFIHEAPGK